MYLRLWKMCVILGECIFSILIHLTKHLKGQLGRNVNHVTFFKGGQMGPPVNHVMFFLSKEVSWGPP